MVDVTRFVSAVSHQEFPFVVWGTGEQIRNWTYIDDIVSGTILAAEKIDDATAVNLGTMERIRVIDAVHEILQTFKRKPKIELLASFDGASGHNSVAVAGVFPSRSSLPNKGPM
jgi:nucleoside-diphosphate-sugar epimerase